MSSYRGTHYRLRTTTYFISVTVTFNVNVIRGTYAFMYFKPNMLQTIQFYELNMFN